MANSQIYNDLKPGKRTEKIIYGDLKSTRHTFFYENPETGKRYVTGEVTKNPYTGEYKAIVVDHKNRKMNEFVENSFFRAKNKINIQSNPTYIGKQKKRGR